MTDSELRDAFPHTRRGVYFNHAATAPLSTPVMDAVQRYLEQRHEIDIENFDVFQPVIQSARSRVASLLGTTSERVEFAPNTSYALNVLARGLEWKSGDRIAIPSGEFPANVYPFLNLRRYGVEVDFIPAPEGRVETETVHRMMRPGTRMLSVSWVQYLSGYRAELVELGDLCRERGVLFCVDGIQGVGALNVDVERAGVDFLACGGHKWVMATQGIGFLYVTKKLQDQLVPSAGWLHGPVDWERLDEYELAFHPDASRFRLGTLNNIGIAALDAALALRERAGPERCERRVLERAGELAAGLAQMGLARYGSTDPRHASGIVTVEVSEPDALHAHLKANGIETAVRQKKLRFSPTYYNSYDEVSLVLRSVHAFLKRS